MRQVALTFDNGPEFGGTDHVLDTLGAFDVKATFFVIGNKLRDASARRLTERAHAEGHGIGNHTLTHSSPLGEMNGVDSVDEIAATQELLGSLSRELLFRPYGRGAIGPHLLSAAARRYLIDNRFTCVLWNVVPRDWENPNGWVEVALAQCALLDHSVIVLHDQPTGAMRRLPEFLQAVKSMGWTFTLSFPQDCLLIDKGKLALAAVEHADQAVTGEPRKDA